MVRLGWQITASFALWFGIACAGCETVTKSSEPPAQMNQEQNSEIAVDSKLPPVQSQDQGVSNERKSLQIEIQLDSTQLCPGECVDIAVNTSGGNPPYAFSWDHGLPSTQGPHRVCPEVNTSYTVTVWDTGFDTGEYAIPTERVRGSTTITVRDDCSPTGSLDAGVDSNPPSPDVSEQIDADVSGIPDASNDRKNDAEANRIIEPCTTNCPDLEWVNIEGGTFLMGSAQTLPFTPMAGYSDSEYELPQHEVTVQSFKMSKTEVMVEQYGICVDAGVCSEPTDSDIQVDAEYNWGVPGRENHPVNGVDWHQASDFAAWLGGRLPSEAEWEYAARSRGQDIVYPWGNREPTCEYAVMNIDAISYNYCGYESTMEVCSKPLGNTVQGLCDMAGNILEWVEDGWHEDYSGAPSDGQPWMDSLHFGWRVVRGGNWKDSWIFCRTRHRRWHSSVSPTYFIGFRVVLDFE